MARYESALCGYRGCLPAALAPRPRVKTAGRRILAPGARIRFARAPGAHNRTSGPLAVRIRASSARARRERPDLCVGRQNAARLRGPGRHDPRLCASHANGSRRRGESRGRVGRASPSRSPVGTSWWPRGGDVLLATDNDWPCQPSILASGGSIPHESWPGYTRAFARFSGQRRPGRAARAAATARASGAGARVVAGGHPYAGSHGE